MLTINFRQTPVETRPTLGLIIIIIIIIAHQHKAAGVKTKQKCQTTAATTYSVFIVTAAAFHRCRAMDRR